jgi:hypothetical protein
MGRVLYATRHGEQASKRQAALWAVAEFPQWATLIQDALLWRDASNDEEVDHDATFGETLRFVQFAIGHISAA